MKALRLILPVAALLFGGRAVAAVNPVAAQGCARLQGIAIPSGSIGLPTTGAKVETATLVAADAPGNRLGEYCAVKGFVLPVSPAAPKMEFQVNLPTAWNRKAVQLGGGGYDGTLVTGLDAAALQPGDVANPLARGYVTLGSDSGHKGGPGFDGTFGLNDEALLNYGRQSVKKVHDVAITLIRARYAAAPRRFYFVGASQGGHEALDAAARYPADYDGVVANYPAYNVTLLHLGSWNVGKALYGQGGAGWLNPVKTKLLTDAVYAACDDLDGARDGIIANVTACKARFTIETLRATLRCPEGRDAGDGCLSDAQITAVATIAAPYRPGFAIAGMDAFPPFAILEGSLFRQGSTFGSRPVPPNPPGPGDALLYNVGAATIRYIITRQPAFDALAFNPGDWRARIEQVGRIMDVTDVDLTAFRRKGGKIIMTHGTIDDFITPYNSIAYFERQRAKQGQAALDTFLRFYLIPGFSHGFGPFNARYDGLGVIDRWVETKRAPGQLTATDGNKDARRSRPMCRYPSWPRYAGAGSLDHADSFACVAG